MTRPHMFATLVGTAHPEKPIEVGDLVIIEVPGNCAILDTDAQRATRIRAIAYALGEWWGGTTAGSDEGPPYGLLDELYRLTRDEETSDG